MPVEQQSSETWRMSGWVDAKVNRGVTKSDKGRCGPQTGWRMAS